MPRSLFLFAVMMLCVAAQTQAPDLTATAQHSFRQSDEQLRAAEAKIQSAIATVKARMAQSPGEAASLNTVLAKLEGLLQHTQQLESQAAQVKAPIGNKLTAGKKLDAHETASTVKNLSALVSQAQADAQQAVLLTPQQAMVFHPPVAGHAPPPPPPVAAPAPVPAPVPAPSPAPVPAPVGEGGNGAAAPAASDNTSGHTPDHAGAGGGARLSEAEANWFPTLQNGRLQYSVPTTMEWKVPSTITVTVSGPKAAATPLAGANGNATIPVSAKMIVRVSCPQNPSEFTFAPQAGTTEEQFVPTSGTTTWQWSVTPNLTSKTPQTIVVQAWVVFSDKRNVNHALPVYNAPVQIQVKFGTLAKRLFELDPEYWLKYGLPGGAGFVFVSGLFGGFWRWMAKRKKKASPAEEREKPSGTGDSGNADEPDFGG